MNKHKYILEPYTGPNTLFNCLSCGEPGIFSRYIDNETRKQIDPSVGRCNRENNCGYHYTPKQYFKENKIVLNTAIKINPIKVVNKIESKGHSWLEEIKSLESFFECCQEFPESLILNGSQKILNPKLFIASHSSIVKENDGNPTYLTYLERLKTLKGILQKSNR